MSQAVHERVLKREPVNVHCGDRPGDLRVKVERRSRGRLEQLLLRARALLRRVTAR